MKIAAYQFAVSKDIAQNYNEIKKAIVKAKDQDVELIVFPECCLTGYPPRDIPESAAVDFDEVNKACFLLQSLSDEQDISFLVGTICKENGQIYNRAILFRPNMAQEHYDKRALWGWDKDNFTVGKSKGVFYLGNLAIGVRICFEIRFPEYFRELYMEKADINIVLFYDVSDYDDVERYEMIKGHIQTRAVENVTTTLSVNAISPFQTAPTAVFGKSGQIYKECERNKTGLLIFDFDKSGDDFGEQGRREISDFLSLRNGC